MVIDPAPGVFDLAMDIVQRDYRSLRSLAEHWAWDTAVNISVGSLKDIVAKALIALQHQDERDLVAARWPHESGIGGKEIGYRILHFPECFER